MTDHELPDLLDRVAESRPVGPPPIDDMVRNATRSRRRRTTGVVAGGAVAVALVVTGAQLVGGQDRAPAPIATPSPSAAPVPEGMRLVGIGHAAIAVPESWGTNQTRCGAAAKDTVIIDVGAVEACGLIKVPAVDSVWIQHGVQWNQFEADGELEIDGVPAESQAPTCPGDGQLCSGAVHIPAEDVYFIASSPTREGVQRILDRVRVLTDEVAVPGYQTIPLTPREGARPQYVQRVEALGLQANVVTRHEPPLGPGTILEVAPAPGTVLEPGETVTVTVVADPRGPADEVAVNVGTLHGEMGYGDVTDAQIRAGATLHLQVGDTIWAYASGKRSRTVAGSLDGASLELDGWKDGPNYPHSWKAVAPGRTTITLTITADGSPVTMGTVTVIVDQ